MDTYLLPSFLASANRAALRAQSNNKKPAHPRTSAAGKCLTQMDLPLAGEPSPPYPSRLRLHLERLHRDAQPINKPWGTLLPEAFRARLEFVARAHREDPCTFVAVLRSTPH